MYSRICSLLFIFLLFSSCNGSQKTNLPQHTANQIENNLTENNHSGELISNEEKGLKAGGKTRNYGSGDVVTKGFLDHSGNMWFTTLREGVFRYDGESFINLTEADGLCNNSVSAIIEDKEGVIWFGTASGLCSYDGKTFRNTPIPKNEKTSDWLERGYPIINPNGILSLIQDRNGVFWIGSNGGGAFRYDGKKFTSFLKNDGRLMPDSLHHNVITSILEDNTGNIWFSSFSHGGVSKYDGTTLTHYGMEDGLGDDMISTSFLDKSGNIWFGTRSGGMSYYNGTSFSNLVASEGPCQNNMASIYEDETGKLMIASFARSGACWYDGKSFTPFQVEGSENLVDIKFISEDKTGNLWFGGRYGVLWKFDGEVLADYTQKGR